MWGKDFGNKFCLQSWAVGRDKLSWLGVKNCSDNSILTVSTTLSTLCSHTWGIPLEEEGGSDTPEAPEGFGKSPEGTAGHQMLVQEPPQRNHHPFGFGLSPTVPQWYSWSCPALSSSGFISS